MIGGRGFLAIEGSTVAQDLKFLELISRSGIESVVPAEGEPAEALAGRLLAAVVASGTLLDFLGCLLIPEEVAPATGEPGETWTPEIGAETARFLGQLRSPPDKAQVRSLILTLLISFFELGIASWGTSMTSSNDAVPTGEATPAAAVSAAGRSSSMSSRVTMSAPSPSSPGPSLSRSSSTAGG